MRLGIKKKLLITYTLAIIIPVGVTLMLFIIGNFYISSRNDFTNLNLDYSVINGAVDNIQKNYQYIGDYDRFYTNVVEHLKGKDDHIIIVNNEGRLLFHSNDKEGSIKKIPYSISSETYYDMEISDENDRVVKLVAPLISNNIVVGKMELSLDRFQLDMDIINEFLKFLFLIAAVGIMVLILLILLFTSMVSKGVIKPLNNLSEAASYIAEGNLDMDILYDKNDEFGQFSRVFNTMRIKLKESLEKQQKLERARKELVASISHDLRTPITSIKGYVEAIQDGKTEGKEQMTKYLSIIKDKTEKLDRLIDDLFQFSQLELGKLQMDKKICNSRDMIEDILTGYFFDFSNNCITLEVVEPIPSVNINIDQYFIWRVFDNILQNSKKYVPIGGKVQVSTRVQGSYFEIMIKDNGKGIKNEDLPNIFNRFYRGEKSRSREYGGIGLGLAICKQIIEDHEGRIWVESVYGQGSSFYISIPICT